MTAPAFKVGDRVSGRWGIGTVRAIDERRWLVDVSWDSGAIGWYGRDDVRLVIAAADPWRPAPAAVQPGPVTDAIALVLAEVERARAKFPKNGIDDPSISDDRRLAIIAEEVGEVAELLNDSAQYGLGVRREDLRAELAQVAAAALRWLQLELDQEGIRGAR